MFLLLACKNPIQNIYVYKMKVEWKTIAYNCCKHFDGFVRFKTDNAITFVHTDD